MDVCGRYVLYVPHLCLCLVASHPALEPDTGCRQHGVEADGDADADAESNGTELCVRAGVAVGGWRIVDMSRA